MMVRSLVGSLLVLIFSAGCGEVDGPVVIGDVLVFELNDSTSAVFPITVRDTCLFLQNGQEVMSLSRVQEGVYRVPVFGGAWVFDSNKKNRAGFWVDSLRLNSNYRVPLSIQSISDTNQSESLIGNWDIWFGEDEGEARARLELYETPVGLLGTMRTPTGDYRYLTGTLVGQQLTLQTYDGAHLYLFTCRLSGARLRDGHFYSGNHYHTTWRGEGSVDVLEAANINTFQIKPEQRRVTLRDHAGNWQVVQLGSTSSDVVVVDVLGSWCPNCMDEVRLLSEMHKKHPDVPVISIAYERDTTVAGVSRRLRVFQDELTMGWPIFYGGPANKAAAAQTFSFLDRVISFPTTLFIYSDGRVVVHSGFNGPATGAAYEAERALFERLFLSL